MEAVEKEENWRKLRKMEWRIGGIYRQENRPNSRAPMGSLCSGLFQAKPWSTQLAKHTGNWSEPNYTQRLWPNAFESRSKIGETLSLGVRALAQCLCV